MRRKDREIHDFEDMIGILRQSDTLRLGLQDDEGAYVVPVSFGMEASGGRATLYFHGAAAGRKARLLERGAPVCVEADRFLGYELIPGGPTARYESVIGLGRARRLSGAEAERGLALICAHCGFPDYETRGCPAAVYALELESLTGKRNPPSTAEA